MRGISCTWVEEHLDEYLADTLPEEQQAMVRVHLSVCDSCRDSAQIWAGLEAAAPSAPMRPMSPLVEHRIASGHLPEPIEVSAGPLPRVVTIAIPAALAAAAAIALLLVLPDDDPDESPTSPTTRAIEQLDPVEADHVAGSTADETAGPEVADTGRRVIRVAPGTALWLADDAEVSVQQLDATAARFRLRRGFAVAEVGPVEPGFRFVIATPDGEVEARGTVFSVRVGRDRRSRVRVAEGVVEVRRAGRREEARMLDTGQEAEAIDAPRIQAASPAAITADMAFVFEPISAEPPVAAVVPVPQPSEPAAAPEPQPDLAADTTSPAEVPPKPLAKADDEADSGHTPESMFKLAQAYRRSRMFPAAARTYERLVGKFPDSAAAANALVALGQLELSALGKPAVALGRFEGYLEHSTSGALAAEARVGRVRALARLGRIAQLESAARDYLSVHPAGRAAPEMHRRIGDARAKGGNCGSAIAEYQLVIDRWPTSPQAKRARAGLDSCGDVP